MPANPSVVQQARILSQSMRDLEKVTPWRGFLKIGLGIGLFFAAIHFAFSPDSHVAMRLLSFVVVGLTVAYCLITTHDAIHHTLTGWAWFDEVVPRIISAHFFWAHGVYAELHKLHHHMNGLDPRDPERTMWTVDEYQAAGPFGKFWARHQIILEVFVGGGFFKICENLYRLKSLPQITPSIKKQLMIDVGLIVAVQGFWISYALSHGSGRS